MLVLSTLSFDGVRVFSSSSSMQGVGYQGCKPEKGAMITSRTAARKSGCCCSNVTDLKALIIKMAS